MAWRRVDAAMHSATSVPASPALPGAPSGGAAPATGPLADRFGRVARDLRISLTDRCNLRCTYCLPAEGLPWQPREQHLTADEIVRVAQVLIGLGVRTIRLAALHALPGLEDIALTTNGVLLAKQAEALAAAGGARLNVSIDTADPTLFHAVTRRDDLQRVLDGLAAAAKYPQLRPLKLNAVALAGVTEQSLDGLLAVAASADAELRFIEPMPLDADRAWSPDDGLSGAQLRELLGQRATLRRLPAPASATAQRYELGPGGQTVGFISSVTEPFCESCDRLRLTADGQLRSCLFSHEETDLRAVLRDGGDLEQSIRGAVWRKPRGHGIDDPSFLAPARPMNRIGG